MEDRRVGVREPRFPDVDRMFHMFVRQRSTNVLASIKDSALLALHDLQEIERKQSALFPHSSGANPAYHVPNQINQITRRDLCSSYHLIYWAER